MSRKFTYPVLPADQKRTRKLKVQDRYMPAEFSCSENTRDLVL